MGEHAPGRRRAVDDAVHAKTPCWDDSGSSGGYSKRGCDTATRSTARQRDLFPLPAFGDTLKSSGSRLCRRSQQRLHRRLHWEAWADRGIDTLNGLYGRGQQSQSPPSAAQRLCVDNLRNAYRQVGDPPAHFCRKEALSELLANTSVYADSNANVVPYSKELVSWPSVNQSHVMLRDCLGRADQEWFREWRTHMLRPVAEARALRTDCGLRRPYVDPRFWEGHERRRIFCSA